MRSKADGNRTERRGRSLDRQAVSAPRQVSPGREWKGLRMGALALCELQWPTRGEKPPPGALSGLSTASMAEEEAVRPPGWRGG